MNTCLTCAAYRFPSNKAKLFCPLGYAQVKLHYIVMPKDTCPKPDTHVEAMALYEEHKANDAISERE
jgi:hypothetical protein